MMGGVGRRRFGKAQTLSHFGSRFEEYGGLLGAAKQMKSDISIPIPTFTMFFSKFKGGAS